MLGVNLPTAVDTFAKWVSRSRLQVDQNLMTALIQLKFFFVGSASFVDHVSVLRYCFLFLSFLFLWLLFYHTGKLSSVISET